jgi:hypothetical protein
MMTAVGQLDDAQRLMTLTFSAEAHDVPAPPGERPA